MRYSLVVREDEESVKVSNIIKDSLDMMTLTDEKPDIVIVVGGDGTMLKAFHLHQKSNPYYVCVGTGTLGFYADWQKSEVDELIKYIKSKETPHVSYPLLEVELIMGNGEKVKLLGLNELIVKSNTTSTFIMNTYLNGELFQCFRGDGMVFSTPSGSTGYNHSLMGSIVHPSLECLQVTELAAINNNIYKTLNRPILIPNHHILKGAIESDIKQVIVGVDGQRHFVGEVSEFQIKVSSEKVKFLRYRDFAFWNRIKDKFL